MTFCKPMKRMCSRVSLNEESKKWVHVTNFHLSLFLDKFRTWSNQVAESGKARCPQGELPLNKHRAWKNVSFLVQSQCHHSCENMTMDNASHLLHKTLDKLKSSFSNRLVQPRCLKEQHRKLFLPGAIRLYSAHSKTNKSFLCFQLLLLQIKLHLILTYRYLSILFYSPQCLILSYFITT